MRIDRDSILALLEEAQRKGATDVHLKVPRPPCLRIDGELVPTEHPKLLPDETHRAAGVLLGLAGVESPLTRDCESEFAFGIQGLGRFRVHLFRQRGSVGILIHRMAVEVPNLGDLGAPLAWTELAGAPGLVLCTGSRRRELLAALVHGYNQARQGHVILIAEMMEYLHKDQSASISQREVGIDTEGWASGIQSALRQDPDLVVLGDVADREVAELVLRAAENGVSVMVGTPNPDPSRAVPWFISLFGSQREGEVSRRVAEVLVGAVALGHRGPMELGLNDAVRQAIGVGSPLPPSEGS